MDIEENDFIKLNTIEKLEYIWEKIINSYADDETNVIYNGLKNYEHLIPNKKLYMNVLSEYNKDHTVHQFKDLKSYSMKKLLRLEKLEKLLNTI